MITPGYDCLFARFLLKTVWALGGAFGGQKWIFQSQLQSIIAPEGFPCILWQPQKLKQRQHEGATESGKELFQT